MASYGIIAFVGFFTSKFFYTGPLWKIEIIDYAFNSLAGIIAILIILIFSYIFFARGLKGFGLNIKTLHKDLLAAFVNLLAVWPIMLVVLILTAFFAKIINGSDYQIQKHEELVSISENTVIWAKIAIALAAIIVTPVLEELLFRGLLQTTFRSALRTKYAAWIAIALTAMLFAMMHSIPAHWPTLFVLGACMGYSYEKSGSLFRPIFIHAIFNATSIIGVLIQ